VCLKEQLTDGVQVKTHEKDSKNRLHSSISCRTISKDTKGGLIDYPLLLCGIKVIHADQLIRLSKIQPGKSQDFSTVLELERGLQVLHAS